MSIEEVLIAGFTPIVLALCKRVARGMDREFPADLLPLLAPLIGYGLSWLATYMGTDVDGGTGVIAGMAGVGLREGQDRLKQRIRG